MTQNNLTANWRKWSGLYECELMSEWGTGEQLGSQVQEVRGSEMTTELVHDMI